MKKRLSIFLITAMMIICTPYAAFASTVSGNSAGYIANLLDQRAELFCQAQYDKIKAVDRELAAAGVMKLSTNNTGNTAWFSQTIEYPYNGETYIVKTLTAQPDTRSSCLVLEGNRMVRASHQWLDSSMHTADEDGTIEIAGGQIAYSYAHVTSVSFQYVKRKGEPDSQQILTYISSKGTTAVGYQFPTFHYLSGSVKPDVIQGNRIIDSTPEGYSSAYRAVKAYLDPDGVKVCCTASVQLTGNENENVLYIYPVFPQTPAQLF